MKCEEVQEQLSEYLETLLEGAVARAIDRHLGGCARCTATLADLAQCRSLIAALPQVEPPVGFTTRVMAHVREAAVHPSWWQRLFVAPRIKLPVQATAVVLIGVLSVYLLQKEPAHKQVLQNPEKNLVDISGPQAKLEVRRDSVGGQTIPSVRLVPVETSEKSRPSESKANSLGKQAPSTESEGRPQLLPAKKESVAGPTAAAVKAAATARDSAKRAANTQTDQEALSSAPAVTSELPPQPSKPIAGAIGVSQRRGSPFSPMAPSMDVLSPDRGLRAPVPQRARSTAATPEPDIELVVRLRTQPSPESTAHDSAGALRSLEENDTRKSADEKTSAARAPTSAPNLVMTSWHTIAATRYEQFKKDIAVQGTIESESPLSIQDKESLAKSDRPIRIKVTILPPLPNESAR